MAFWCAPTYDNADIHVHGTHDPIFPACAAPTHTIRSMGHFWTPQSIPDIVRIMRTTWLATDPRAAMQEAQRHGR